MFGLKNVFSDAVAKKTSLDKDAVAQLLKTNPKALQAFEAAYAAQALDEESDNFFEQNSRQASAALRESQATGSEADMATAENLISRIVDELLAKTSVYEFNGDLSVPAKVELPKALPDGTLSVTNNDVCALPETMRPQLTGSLMKVDIAEPSYPSLLYMYNRYLNDKTAKGRRQAYHMFRQGLDILDIDPITYKIIETNPNSMGHWLPALVEACRGQDFFKIPATRIAKVPMTLLQLTRQEYAQLTPTTLRIVDEWAHEAFKLNDNKTYFIKTGTYSSKFDFRNAKVTGAKEIRELGEYLLFIHFQALQMASPLSTPCIYGASTTTEWVVRDFIPDKENNPCIYKGMPLHTEYRIFIDADNKTVIGKTPYWEPETMKKRFSEGAEGGSMHHAHDYLIYKAHEETLMRRYQENIDNVVAHVESILPNLNLHGQWSLDIMQNGDDFWLIDMGLAENSAFYDCVPADLRLPSAENWLPQIPETV